jgi:hypothetical protein
MSVLHFVCVYPVCISCLSVWSVCIFCILSGNISPDQMFGTCKCAWCLKVIGSLYRTIAGVQAVFVMIELE